jgi:uncharacterized protein involved in exopolysaccharide biosynthesis
MEHEPDQDESQEGGGGINLEVFRSYLTFAKNAIKQRRVTAVLVGIVGLAVTFAAAKYLPRSYVCETAMMAVSNGVLDAERGPAPWAGAAGQIMSHDNLEGVINRINLKKTYVQRRPPLLALKDRLITSLFGPMDDKVLTAVLIGTLYNKAVVVAEKDTLTIDVTWTDGQTAAELTEALRESFLRGRHTAEMSAFQDKMAILDSHAVALRAEIAVLAGQMKDSLAAKRAELEAEARAENSKLPPAVKRSIVRRAARAAAATDEQLPELKTRLAALKQELSAAEGNRNARIRAEEAKLEEMKLRLTPAHPQVVTQQERLGIVSQLPSDLLVLRGEVQDLESQIRQREAMRSSPSSGVTTTSTETATGASELLPPEILGLLDERDADPALAAQISGAVVRYGSLRDDIRGAKLALDTAQAAFSRRYQVTVPVEEPSSPTKPKKAVVLGAGAFLSLLLALLVPILLEIRRDVVVERWQVNQFQLPILAELRLPPKDGAG